jgi:hypothetical protein
MRRSIRSHRASDETGAVLLLALGFISFVGLVTVVLLNYADTSFRATTQLRPVRSAQFAADGAVEGAINKLRQFRPDSTAPCVNNLYTVQPPLNGQDIVLNCSNLSVISGATPTIEVILTASCKVASVGCPITPAMVTATTPAMLTAKVRFSGTPPTVSATVLNWSIRR